MGKNIGKNKNKNLSGKYSRKFLYYAKQSAADVLKTTPKRVILKAAEATGDLMRNKIADRITKVSKNSQQNNSETVTNENDKEIPKERYISPEERQKIMNWLDNAPNQLTKFMTKNWVEINDDARGTYNKDSQINFKASVLKSSLRDYSDVYILVKSTTSMATQAADIPNNGDQKVVFKNCVPFTDCRSQINNTQIDNAKSTDVVIYNV